MPRVLLAAVAALALPGIARAGLVTMVARDVPVGSRSLQAAAAPIRFDMLGVHWSGSGSVEYRTRSPGGAWSGWQVVDDDSGPDPASSEGRRSGAGGWRDGSLDWVGEATGAQFRTRGTVARLRAYYVMSHVAKRPVRRLALAGLPAIVPRSGWEADEKIVRAKPLVAPVLELAVVHHTAGSNDYTPAQAAAIVRGIEVYHVDGNGWNDIGYNFLVDRYGTVYEGRAGGIDRNVIGAHALGFNSGTVGVALIGNFTSATPPAAMQSALVRLLAWRLDVAHVDPLSTVVYTSGGNAKFRAGKVVTLRAISGHRDTGPTECPGDDAYRLLPSIARRVALTGLPKLYSPVASGALGSDVRFQARLSGPHRWTVTVTGPSGSVVARHSGRSSAIDWTWSSEGVPRGLYRWSMSAGVSTLPAVGLLGGAARAAPPPPTTPSPAPVPAMPMPAPVTPAPPTRPVLPPVIPPPTTAPPPAAVTVDPLTDLAVTPTFLTPAGAVGGTVTVNFSLALPALVTVQAVRGPRRLVLLTSSLRAGANSVTGDLGALPDGVYRIVVTTAPGGGQTFSQSVPVTIDRMLTGLAAVPALISPNGDGAADASTIGFTLARPAAVQIVIQGASAAVATVFAGQLGSGPQAIAWDGSANGSPVPDGSYTAVVTVTDPLGTVSSSTPIILDTTPPTLTLVDAASLRFQLSEAAVVTATVNGQIVVVPEPQGTFTIASPAGAVATLSAQAVDAAGNPSAVVTSP